MKPLFICQATIFLLILFCNSGYAQNKQPVKLMDSLRTKNYTMHLTAYDTAEKSNPVLSKKERRRLKRRNVITDTINPYQPNNTVTKPLPYNSYQNKEQPLERPIVPAGEIIKEIIRPKKNN